MRILVAFTFSLGGRDAYALGNSLAEIFSCPLDLVTIVRGGEDRAITDSTDVAFQQVVVKQANEWMDEVINETSGPVSPTKNLRFAESYADGLLAAVEDLNSTLLVMGGGRHGALGRVSLGSIGNTLLHSSPVPVALAPRGMRHHPYTRLSRVTAMLGSDVRRISPVITEASDYAETANCALRLVSLKTEQHHKADNGAILEQWAKDLEFSGEVTSEVNRGENIEDAVASLNWKKQEIVLLGSGRLAQKGHLFLGSTANKILRILPVPLVVVPSNPGQANRP